MPIASPAMGFQEVVGFGQETTYGTAASARTPGWIKPLSFTLKNVDPPLQLGGPSGGSVPFVYNATIPRHFRGVQRVAGNITVECDYELLGMFLSNAVGAGTVAADTDIDGTGGHAGTYLHTFNMLGDSTTANTPKSLTIYRINGMRDLRFVGCVIDSLEITAQADSIVIVSMDFIAQSGGNTLVGSTEGAFSAAPYIEFHDSCINYNTTPSTAYTTAGIGATPLSGAAAPMSWSFRIENNLRAVASTCLAGRTIREPIYQGYRKAMLTMTRDYANNNFFDEVFPASEVASYSSYEVRCTSDEAAGADFHAASLYMPAGIVTSPAPDYGGGADILPETITVEAAAPSAGGVPFTARLANTESVAFG